MFTLTGDPEGDHLHCRPPQHAHPLRARLVDRRRRDAVRGLRLPPAVGRLPVLLLRPRLHVRRDANDRVDGGRGFRQLVAARLPRGVSGGGGGEGGGAGSVLVLCCRLDLPPLQRLVGSERAARMLTDEKSSFLFC